MKINAYQGKSGFFSTSKISNQDSSAASKYFSKIPQVLESTRSELSNGAKIIAIRSQKVSVLSQKVKNSGWKVEKNSEFFSRGH